MSANISKIVFTVLTLKGARDYDLLKDIDRLINTLKKHIEGHK